MRKSFDWEEKRRISLLIKIQKNFVNVDNNSSYLQNEEVKKK